MSVWDINCWYQAQMPESVDALGGSANGLCQYLSVCEVKKKHSYSLSLIETFFFKAFFLLVINLNMNYAWDEYWTVNALHHCIWVLKEILFVYFELMRFVNHYFHPNFHLH